MIRTAAQPRAGAAARVTLVVLAAAALRALLAPAGSAVSTVAFTACLAAIAWTAGAERAPGRRWALAPAAFAGVAVGVLLIAPAAWAGWSGRTTAGFWAWAAATAVVATLEEAVIRGPVQLWWTEERGTVAGLLAGALVFALIHLPRYGAAAVPLDLAVGLALGGLRMVCGRVLPCAVAHTVADWGAWFVA